MWMVEWTKRLGVSKRGSPRDPEALGHRKTSNLDGQRFEVTRLGFSSRVLGCGAICLIMGHGGQVDIVP